MSVDYTSDNTFIFSFVRMNPPTPGHLQLIKTMIDKAIDLGVDKAYVITSSSLDGKNPLPCSRYSIPKAKNKSDAAILNNMSQSDLIYKSTILDKMISTYKQMLSNSETDTIKKQLIANFNVIVICSTGSPFGFIYNVIKNDFIDKDITKINMFFIVGRDRADFLDTIVDNFKTKDYVKSINGIILEREGMDALKTTGMGERTISDINPSEYSASFIRGLVKNNQRQDFEEVYNQYLSSDEIEKLYETIKIGMTIKPPPSKYEDENPQSRYFDSGLLPVINESGGKRRRRTTRKQRKTKRRRTRSHTRRYK
jgi:nicotinic acid mononucleotide adenylyltransferase